jgi:hypothetical protein
LLSRLIILPFFVTTCSIFFCNQALHVDLGSIQLAVKVMVSLSSRECFRSTLSSDFFFFDMLSSDFSVAYNLLVVLESDLNLFIRSDFN